MRPNPLQHNPDGTTVLFIRTRVGQVHECLVDTVDYEKVRPYRWCLKKGRRGTCYARAGVCKNGKRTSVLLHQLILPGVIVDHRNQNGLDNTRKNLRPATYSQNSQNQRKKIGRFTSRFRGVSWEKTKKKFRASIKANGRRLNLGCFTSEIAAARVYDAAAIKFFGEFARLNFGRPV